MKIVENLKAGVKLAIMLPVIAVITVPIVMLKLAMMPFNKPPTPDEVATLLRKCIDGTATDDDIDDFTSITVADPRLRDVRDELRALAGHDWTSPETRQTLEGLLRRVEAMPATASA